MQIGQNNYFINNNNIKNTRKYTSFGAIEPNHLFAPMANFSRSRSWAEKMISVINSASKSDLDFYTLMDGVAKEYNIFFTNSSFDSILKFFMEKQLPNAKRFTDAQKVKIFGAERFGLNRQISAFTPITDRFLFYRQPAVQNSKINLSKKPILAKHSRAFKPLFTNYTELNGKKYPLTQVLVIDKLSDELVNKFPFLKKGDIVWQHTMPEYIDRAVKNAEIAYNKIQDLKLKLTKKNNYIDRQILLDEIQNLLAEIDYNLLNAMPYQRGSAGIGSVLNKTILENCKMDVPFVRQGKSVDLEAMTSPNLDYFKHNYADIFIKK